MKDPKNKPPSVVFVREILRRTDDILLPWLDLYELSFQPEEKILVSAFLKILAEKEKGGATGHHLLAAMWEPEKFAGLAYFEDFPGLEIAFFWYLAVLPELRNQGMGAEIYREVIRRHSPAARALCYEVEIPELAKTTEQREFAGRRIAFYRRLGAKTLEGIRYLQSVGPHQQPLPMHLMVHPLGPVTPEEIFRSVKTLCGDLIDQIGELSLA